MESGANTFHDFISNSSAVDKNQTTSRLSYIGDIKGEVNTGDKDLLSIDKFKGVKIVDSRTF
jgi:hypothetical protein